MSLPSFNLHGIFGDTNTANGATVAQAFLKSYREAQQIAMDKENQARDNAVKDELMSWKREDRQRQQEIFDPLEEQKARFGVAADVLDLQQKGEEIARTRELTKAASLKTTADTTILDSFNADPKVRAGLEAGQRLLGGQSQAAASLGALGKITRYGYANDETPDSNSSAGIGAWVGDDEAQRIKAGENTPNRLRSGDLALSPDVERAMQMAGIQPGQSVRLKYADGTTHTGRWMDRTAKEYQGKALTGRFDVYDPDGTHTLRDGSPVVSFSRAEDNAPEVASSQIQTMQDAETFLDGYEAAARHVERFTATDSRGNRTVDPRARMLAEQVFSMETGIKASPMLSSLYQRRQETRMANEAAESVARSVQFFKPGQMEEFRAMQPGAFRVLEQWNAGQPVSLQDKLKAAELFTTHADKFVPKEAEVKKQATLTELNTLLKSEALTPEMRKAAESQLATLLGVPKPAPKPDVPTGQVQPQEGPALTVAQIRAQRAESQKLAEQKELVKEIDTEMVSYAGKLKEEGITPLNIAASILKDEKYATGRVAPTRPWQAPSEWEMAGGGREMEEIPALDYFAKETGLSVENLRQWAETKRGDVFPKKVQAETQNLPSVQSDADWQALPSGTTYRDPNGNTRTKP